MGAENETARIIIYMKKSQSGPGIFLDRRQIVWMDKGYISFRVDPGPHELYIKGAGFAGWGPENDPVKLDARAGATYFYEAGRWGVWIKYRQLKTKSEEICMKDIKGKKPLDAKFVLMTSFHWILLQKNRVRSINSDMVAYFHFPWSGCTPKPRNDLNPGVFSSRPPL